MTWQVTPWGGKGIGTCLEIWNYINDGDHQKKRKCSKLSQDYTFYYIELHSCPSRMIENLMLSNSTLMRDNQIIGSHQTSKLHYNDVIKGKIASQIISLAIVYSTVYSDADQRKHQSSAPLAFVRGIAKWHKWPVTREIFPFVDVIMWIRACVCEFELCL